MGIKEDGRTKEEFSYWKEEEQKGKEEDGWRKEEEGRGDIEGSLREENGWRKEDGWIREEENSLSLEEIDKLCNFFLAYMFCIELVVHEGENAENESETFECRDIYSTDTDNNKSFLYLLM